MNLRLQALIDEAKSYVSALSNRGGFVRNSFTLTMGTAFAQSIPIMLSPVLARLFSPHEFGLFAVVSSITAIISVISTGKYETVVVIAKSNRNAVNLIALSLILSFLISIISLAIFFSFSGTVVNLLKQPELKHWILLSPLISFLISIYLCYNEWCIRLSHFKTLSLNKVVNASSISLSNVLFGFLKIPTGGLIFGEVLGRFISALSCIFNVFRTNISEFKAVTLSRISFLSKRYSDCPKYILPGQFLNTLGGQMVVLLITSFFGSSEVGYYSMTILVLYVPSTIISTAVRDVFKQRATAEYNAKKNCYDIFRRITLAISVFSFFIFAVLFVILPDLFQFAFGKEWRIAGEYARILSPMVFISFISESVFGVLIIAEKMKAVLIWQAEYFIVNIGSLLLGYFVFKDIKMALLFFMAGKSLVHLHSLYLSYIYSRG